jgi:hypothetical protein
MANGKKTVEIRFITPPPYAAGVGQYTPEGCAFVRGVTLGGVLATLAAPRRQMRAGRTFGQVRRWSRTDRFGAIFFAYRRFRGILRATVVGKWDPDTCGGGAQPATLDNVVEEALLCPRTVHFARPSGSPWLPATAKSRKDQAPCAEQRSAPF